MPKLWWKSKTILFNLFVLVVITLEANLHYLQHALSVDVYGVIAVVLAVGNKILRFVTSQPLTFTSSRLLALADDAPVEDAPVVETSAAAVDVATTVTTTTTEGASNG